MGKQQSAPRRAPLRDDDAVELFDVPATVLCARCGQPDCAGCSPANEDDSGVVTIVPWERPAGGAWTRLWSTASATTLGAEAFFASLPDGELSPAVRFAFLAETLAIISMMTLLAPLALIVVPNLALEVIADPVTRATVLRWTALGVPMLAVWMVAAHATHGALLDVGAHNQGSRSQRRRAFRFGLYACGWDLMAGLSSPSGSDAKNHVGLRALCERGRGALRAPHCGALRRQARRYPDARTTRGRRDFALTP